jgi:hypothetical protein
VLKTSFGNRCLKVVSPVFPLCEKAKDTESKSKIVREYFMIRKVLACEVTPQKTYQIKGFG